MTAWPSQHDLDLIYTLPVGLSAYLHSGLCTPYSSSKDWEPPLPQKMLQLPEASSHPVLIARKLLLLGTFLQAILPSSVQHWEASYSDIMHRVVDTAIRLVTTDEDLIRSVEGIECIMIEATYQNYAGNLHRAWMAVRRAMTVAQLMGLHRGLDSPFLSILEPETRAAFDSDQICFRLVEMDNYLSLMLGLPWTSLEGRFATPLALEGCQPIDRVQRIHCAMNRRILQRDEHDFSETLDIDTLLQKAAAEMPPQWWLMPNLAVSNVDGTVILHETMKLMDQITHYHLLIRLHLPYVLRSAPDHKFDQSKITAVNASRDTLVRFVTFRTSNPAHYYCRGTDFLAFIAITVLCLAHLDSCIRQSSTQNAVSGIAFNYLVHSRLSDRGLMERSLEVIESMTENGADAMCSKIARILRPLLIVEADAAHGTIYSITCSRGEESESGSHGKLGSTDNGVHIHIPYFGTINFECPSEQNLRVTSVTGMRLPEQVGENNRPYDSGPNIQPVYQSFSQINPSDAQPTQFDTGLPSSRKQPPTLGT